MQIQEVAENMMIVLEMENVEFPVQSF